MDRRKAIKLGLGVTAGVTMSAATGCAPGAREIQQGHTPENMDDYLANLDRQMKRIRQGRFVEGFASKATGATVTEELRSGIEPSEKQFQNILRHRILQALTNGSIPSL